MNKRIRRALGFFLSGALLVSGLSYSPVLAEGELFTEEETLTVEEAPAGEFESPEPAGDLFVEDVTSTTDDGIAVEDIGTAGSEEIAAPIPDEGVIDEVIIEEALPEEVLPSEQIVPSEEIAPVAETIPAEETYDVVTEDIISDEAVSGELIEEEFTEGYAFVETETVLYDSAEEDNKEKGSFGEKTVVYAELYQSEEIMEDDWFTISYALEDAETAEAVIDSAYVRRADLVELTEDELAEYLKQFEEPEFVDYIDHEGYLLKKVIFIYPEETETEIPDTIVEELPTEELPVEAVGAEQAVSITENPADVAVKAGTKAEFHVAATGTGLTYQWQTKLDETTGWGNTGLNGSKTDTLSFNAPSAYNGRKYRCIVTDSAGNKATSEEATLTIPVLKITTQPEEQTVKAGATVTFHIEATGEGLTYQWQTKLSDTADWGNTGLNGCKTDTLNFKVPSVYSGRKYRCIVTDTVGNRAISLEALLTVSAVEITGQPEDVIADVAGAKVTFHVEASGNDITYQWQTKLNADADWGNTSLTGNQTDTLTVTAYSAYDGRKYRCVVTDASGNQATTREALLTVTTFKISAQPEDQTVKAGENVSFHIEASGKNITYQWQTKLTADADWGNTGLAGNKTDTLSFTAWSAYTGRQYRCVATDASGKTLESDPATLTIESVEIITNPEDCVVGAGKAATFHVEAKGTDLTYQWETKLNETASWGKTGLAGSKTDTLSFNAPSSYSGRQYRCVVTDKNGKSVTSEPATLTVTKPVITKQPEDKTVTAAEKVSISVEAEGEGLTYQWETKLNETADWGKTGLNGNKTNTLSFNVPSAYNGRQYRCVITDANGVTVTSAAMTLTVNIEYTVNDIVYRLIDGKMSVVGYVGDSTSYVVEEVVKEYTVTVIAEGAFENNANLESIDLPDTIEVIGKRAFANCTNLKSMK